MRRNRPHGQFDDFTPRSRSNSSRSLRSAKPRPNAPPARPTHASSTKHARHSPKSREASLPRIALAYEPVWAIGTGNNCDPDEADRMMRLIRTAVPGLQETPILYGGSMKASNVADYTAKPNINGGLIGGASLDPRGFARFNSPSAIPHRPLVLAILDGWGCADAGRGNAIAAASTPHWDALLARYPHTTLEASGIDVGLPAGIMGNSEVGHLNLGSGRVVPQGLVVIDEDVSSGALARNPVADRGDRARTPYARNAALHGFAFGRLRA